MGKIGLGDGFELVVCPLLLAADPEPVSYPGDLLGSAVLPLNPVPDPVLLDTASVPDPAPTLAPDPEPVSYPGDLLGLAVLPPLPVPDPVYKRGLIDLNSTHVLYLHF